MAIFPSIVPSSQLYIRGDFPNVIQSSSSGVTTGFRRGNRRTDQTLQLSFTSLNETQVNLIRTHFDGQGGSFEMFFLSSSIWNGYTTPPVALVTDFGWLYNSPPIITDSLLTSKWDVQIELISEPIDIGDLIFDAEDSSTTSKEYILDALTSSASPTRDNIIDSRNSA